MNKGEIDEIIIVIIAVGIVFGWMLYSAYSMDLHIGEMLKAAGL